jgi:hypothetical protein
LKADPIPWLLEQDNPSVRHFALADLLDRSQDDAEVIASRKAIVTSEPVRGILDAQYPEGYWVKPGRGYSPKYRATIWQVMLLADLGVPPSQAIDRACRFVLENSYLHEQGLFSATKAGTGTVNCLNGNLLRALIRLGYSSHPAVQKVSQSLAERIARDGFVCRANTTSAGDRTTWLPCAWGAVKALHAFALVPAEKHSSAMSKTVARGVDLLLSRDLSVSDYPSRSGRVSPLWFKLGFPLGYHSDVLEAVDVLAQFGFGGDQRLRAVIDLILSKQDGAGRWPLEHTLERTWTKFGQRGEPSKWVTLRALRMLKRLP